MLYLYSMYYPYRFKMIGDKMDVDVKNTNGHEV